MEDGVSALRDDETLRCLASCELDTEYGKWTLYSYESKIKTQPNKVLVKRKKDIGKFEHPIVRIHSECYTGDVLFSKHCDCGPQLRVSMERIEKNGEGVVIFPSEHEGRGIGFTNKVRAYHKIKTEGLDTYEANEALHFKEDERSFEECTQILKQLTVNNFLLLTSNPLKINALNDFVFTTENLICGLCETNSKYLTDKSKKHKIV